MGFAIPVELVKRVVPQLIRNGRVALPGLGIVPADDMAAVRIASEGVVIADIKPGSPAERAGLQAADLAGGRRGDIVTVADGQPERTGRELMSQIEQLGVGHRIELGLERANGPAKIELEIVELLIASAERYVPCPQPVRETHARM